MTWPIIPIVLVGILLTALMAYGNWFVRHDWKQEHGEEGDDGLPDSS